VNSQSCTASCSSSSSLRGPDHGVWMRWSLIDSWCTQHRRRFVDRGRP